MVDLLVGIALICMLLFAVFVAMLVVRLVKKQSVKSILKSLAVFVVVFAISISGARTISNSKETVKDQNVSKLEETVQEAPKPKEVAKDTDESVQPKPAESLKVDFEKVKNDWLSEMTNKDYHPLVEDVSVVINEDNQSIVFSAAVNDAANKEYATELADTMIRRFGSICNMYNKNISPPSSDYYGGIFYKYDIIVGVAPLSKIDNQNEWLVYQAIAKGTNQPIKGRK